MSGTLLVCVLLTAIGADCALPLLCSHLSWKHQLDDPVETHSFFDFKTSGIKTLASVGMSRRLSEQTVASSAFRFSPLVGFGACNTIAYLLN